MRTRMVWIVVVTLTALVLMAGGAGALAGQSAPEATVAGAINYQGRLTDPSGAPLTGTFRMRFQIYTALSGGTLLWDSGVINVDVDHGLFNVKLTVNPAHFNGQALWLRIHVNGEWLTPRQELLPVPYALSLRPGAEIVGDSAEGWILRAANTHVPAIGSALWGEAATGSAVYGKSTGGYGLLGYSDRGNALVARSSKTAGIFDSSDGYGIQVTTSGTDHWDHGGTFAANWGWGIYARSARNHAIRAEAGDIGGLGQGVGRVGVVAIGQDLGVFGSSGAGPGVYSVSKNNCGIWGETDRADRNYGLYTADNLYSLNYHLAGAVMQVVQNGGAETLEPGDVVVFSGLGSPLEEGAPPVVQVARTGEAHSAAVAGVVYSRFNGKVASGALWSDDQGVRPDREVTLPGPVAPGEYLLLVIQGPAQVKASALSGPIRPGDLLSSTELAGHAARAATLKIEGIPTARPGTVLGKALEPLEAGEKLIYIFVTLQ